MVLTLIILLTNQHSVDDVMNIIPAVITFPGPFFLVPSLGRVNFRVKVNFKYFSQFNTMQTGTNNHLVDCQVC